jgi:tetratricopeptide (TPR) repeat protein
MKDSYNEKMLRLIDEMVGEDDDERRVFLADSILEMDPDNGIAKYMKWQSTDDGESIADSTLLQEAVASLKPDIENLDEYDGDGETLYSLYVSMLSDLASSFYMTDEKDKAFRAASEFMKLDREGVVMGRLVYYAMLVERGDFEELLASAEEDICETPSGEYCRAIAVLETGGSQTEAAEYLLNAISLDPDLPFYMLGLWEMDEKELFDSDDSDGYAEEVTMVVPILSDLWLAAGDHISLFSVIASAFGYLTRRMNGFDDTEMLERTYRETGCLEDMREARDILDAMLADGREQREVDEEALLMLQEAEYFGLVE